MKRTLFLITLIHFSLLSLSQSILTSNNEPVNIKNKLIKDSRKKILKIFKYDNDEINKGLGVRTEAYVLGTFIEIPDTTLDSYIGQNIDFVRFGIENSAIITNAKIQIYENSLDSNPVVEREVDPDNILPGWNQFQLNNTYTIGSANIYIGVMIETSSGGFTLTYDTDPTSFPEYSGHTILNGDYFGTLSNEVGIDADYNIQAIITDGQGAEFVDLAFTGIESSLTSCSFTSQEILKASVINMGDDSVIIDHFNLQVTINDMVVTQQVTPTTLYPGVEKIINLPAIDMSESGVYYIDGYMDFNDAVKENNSYSTILQSGNAKLRIDLVTDNYPEETSWVLVDQFDNLIATNDLLESESYYKNEICIVDTNCYTWILKDANGDGINFNDTLNYAFALFFNDSLIITGPNEANFGNEYVKYGIGYGCKTNDIALTEINLPYYDTQKSIPIEGVIQNRGKDTLTTFTVQYKVGDFVSIVDTITNISVETGNNYRFVHSTEFNFNEDKAYKVELIVDNPNLNLDENTGNNTFQQNIIINSNVIPKRQLIEHFTSSTNDECFTFTPLVDEVLAERPEEYSLIRYPMNIPDYGDPYYTEYVGVRAVLYNVKAIPALYRNGMFDNDYSMDNFDHYSNQKTIISIDANAYYSFSDAIIDVNLNSKITTDTNLVLYIAIIENTTFNNIGTNGQTEFYNVLHKMLPNAHGFNLPVINANETYNYSINTNLETSFVEEMSDLSVVVFVQDKLTKHILQSTMRPVKMVDNVSSKQSNDIIIYPNPFLSEIRIDKFQSKSYIQITDIFGKLMYSSFVNNTHHVINTNELKQGVYVVHFLNSDKQQISSRKIVKLQ